MNDRAQGIIKRFSAASVISALKDTPAVMVIGPRQCGKTTLARELIDGERPYLTLDNQTTRLAAQTDPTGMIRDLDRAIIDEVQLAPDLLRAIKESIDNDRRPGRFLLTGSANILTLPKISESLAGRMEIVTLLPLSRAEVRGQRPAFLQNALAGQLAKPAEKMIALDLIRAVLTGGYPEMLDRARPDRRSAWARSYIQAIVQRDVREIVEIDKLDHVPRLIQVLAHHSAQLTNFTKIGGQVGLDDKTTRAYLGILEQLFLIKRVEPWFNNRLSRLVKTPKLHFLDSGLLAALLGATEQRITADRSIFGPLLETFVMSEIMKQFGWLDDSCTLTHYRDKDKNEVDFVIENAAGDVVGIEVKSAASVSGSDFKGLKKLADATGTAFKLGVVLYDGELSLPFGERMYTAPVSCLWGK
jgi:predicted AAA+ superfamily ATPase